LWFQLAQLVKSLVIEQGTWVQISPTPKINWCLGTWVQIPPTPKINWCLGTWVQIPPTPKINWCLGLIVRAIIMSGRYRFKFYHNYQKKNMEIHALIQFFMLI
jgi:hypothetical protein